MPFTVYHLDSERGLRGGERQLLYLARWLAAGGHRSVVVCRAGAPLEAEARRQGVETMTAPFLGEWDPVTAWRLARLGAPGAVLHAHTGHAAGAASLAARFGGPPWVAHRRVDFRLSGRCSARFKYGSAASVIAVSAAIKAVLESDGVEAGRIAVVPDAIPVGAAEARLCGLDEPWGPSDRAAARRAVAGAAGLDPGHLWVGNLAALVPHKDQANLVRAAALVVREEPRARFLLVGEGPLRRDLEALADSLGVKGAVRFPGHRADPRPWLRSFDVYCQSSWGEGMGSVLLEAMACRVPVVATTAGGIPEVVSDGETARLVPPRDPAALAAALLAALRDRGESERRAAAAERSLPRFSVEAMGRSVLGLYEAALGARA